MHSWHSIIFNYLLSELTVPKYVHCYFDEFATFFSDAGTLTNFFFCSACVIFMIKFVSYVYICSWLCPVIFLHRSLSFLFSCLTRLFITWLRPRIVEVSTYFCHYHATYLYPFIILLQLFEHMNLSLFSNNMQRRIWYGVYRESKVSESNSTQFLF